MIVNSTVLLFLSPSYILDALLVIFRDLINTLLHIKQRECTPIKEKTGEDKNRKENSGNDSKPEAEVIENPLDKN